MDNYLFKTFRFCTMVSLFLFTSCGSNRKAINASSPEWENLFTGKNTDSLRGYKITGFPFESWMVDDSGLKAVAGKNNMDLVTKSIYKNFELSFEWKTSVGGNSGIFFNVQEDQEHVSGNGNSPNWLRNYEMQLLDDIGFYDKEPKRSTGSLYDLIAPKDKVLMPVGQFNTAQLIVKNQHVEHWINGQKIMEYQMDSPELKELVDKSKFKNIKGFAQYNEGHIMFQHHGQEFWYRNIRIRRI